MSDVPILRKRCAMRGLKHSYGVPHGSWKRGGTKRGNLTEFRSRCSAIPAHPGPALLKPITTQLTVKDTVASTLPVDAPSTGSSYSATPQKLTKTASKTR